MPRRSALSTLCVPLGISGVLSVIAPAPCAAGKFLLWRWPKTIERTVIDADTGKPIAEAEVEMAWQNTKRKVTIRSTKTDDKGTFIAKKKIFAGVGGIFTPTAQMRLTISHPDYETRTIHGFVGWQWKGSQWVYYRYSKIPLVPKGLAENATSQRLDSERYALFQSSFTAAKYAWNNLQYDEPLLARGASEQDAIMVLGPPHKTIPLDSGAVQHFWKTNIGPIRLWFEKGRLRQSHLLRPKDGHMKADSQLEPLWKAQREAEEWWKW